MIFAIVTLVLALLIPATIYLAAGNPSDEEIQKLSTGATIFGIAISVLTACLSVSLALDSRDLERG